MSIKQDVRGRQLAAALLRRSLFFIALGALWLTVLLERLTEVRLHEYAAALAIILTLRHVWLNRWSVVHVWPQRFNLYTCYHRLISLGLLVSCLLAVVSGVAISQHLFAWLDLSPGPEMRTLHNAGAAYFLLFVGLHGGLHGSKLYTLLADNFGQKWTRLGLILLLPVGIYGLSTLLNSAMLDKLTLQASFSFFDYDAPQIYGLIDGAAQLLGCALLSALIAQGLLRLQCPKR